MLIQLASNKSISKNGNSSWTNNIQNAFLNNGDQISMKLAFIDTGTSSSDFIKIDQQITLTFTVGYFFLLRDFQGKIPAIYSVDWVQFGGATASDKKLTYILCETNTKLPITRDITIYIPIGTYTAQELAKYMTDEMTKFEPFENVNYGDFGNDALNRFQLLIPYNRIVNQNDPSQTLVSGCPDTLQCNTAQNTDYTYPQIGSAVGGPAYYLLYKFGTSQPYIIYEDGAFKISLFDPVPKTDDDNKPGVYFNWYEGFGTDGNVPCHYKPYQGGCYLIDVQDDYSLNGSGKSFFFDILKFNRNILNRYDQPNPKRIKDICAHTAVDLSTLLLSLNDADGTYLQQFAPYNDGSQLGFFNIIENDRVYFPSLCVSDYSSVDNIGLHYLLNIKTIKSELKMDSDAIDITAILPRYYTNESTITIYSDSSIIYTHRGTPINLDNIQVEILDARTMQPAIGLGVNNYIYLEIFRTQQSD